MYVIPSAPQGNTLPPCFGPLTYSEKRISDRFGVSPSLARTICVLARIGEAN